MSTKVRRFWILTTVYLAFSGTSLALALHEERVAERIEASRRAGVASTRAQELSLRRVAGFGKAGAILATTFYALGLGVVAAPGPIRLVSGNLAVSSESSSSSTFRRTFWAFTPPRWDGPGSPALSVCGSTTRPKDGSTRRRLWRRQESAVPTAFRCASTPSAFAARSLRWTARRMRAACWCSAIPTSSESGWRKSRSSRLISRTCLPPTSSRVSRW